MEIYSAHRAYKSCTFDNYCTDFGIKRRNNGRYRSGIRRFRPWLAHLAGHNWPALRDVANGRRALDTVVYNKTASPAGNHLSFYLGRNALTYRAGMGIGGDLAVFRLLMLVLSLAKAFMAACDINHIMRSCVSEHPAHYRGNFNSIAHRPALRSSSSSGLSFRMAFPRCEMAFFSSAVNWATVLLRCGTKKIGS